MNALEERGGNTNAQKRRISACDDNDSGDGNEREHEPKKARGEILPTDLLPWDQDCVRWTSHWI